MHFGFNIIYSVLQALIPLFEHYYFSDYPLSPSAAAIQQ